MEDVSRRCIDGKRHEWVFFVNAESSKSCFKCFKCSKKRAEWIKERPLSLNKSQMKSDNELINIFLDLLSIEDISSICERGGVNKNRVYEAIRRKFNRK